MFIKFIKELIIMLIIVIITIIKEGLKKRFL